jgi:hypothetical protein
MTVGCACGWLLVPEDVGAEKLHTALANMLKTTKMANTAITICILRCDFCFARFAMLFASCFNFARDYTIVETGD